MELVWLVAGVVVGAAGALFLFGRLSDRRVTEVEERVQAQLQHAQDETLQADLAHSETKARLVELQLAHGPLGERAAAAEQQAQAAMLRAEDTEARLAAAQKQVAALAEQLRLAQEKLTPPPAVSAVKAGADGKDRRLKAIEAKLAMLPAGSSARTALESERDRLAGV